MATDASKRAQYPGGRRAKAAGTAGESVFDAGVRKARRKTIALKAIAVAVLLALCVACALLVGDADYNASAIGWIPLISVVCALVGAFAYLQVLRHGLVVTERGMQGSCKRGEDVEMEVGFRNLRPLFFFCIRALLYVSDCDGKPVTRTETTLALAPKASYDMRFSVRFDHVGVYSAGVYQVQICDYLRLFTKTTACGGKTTVEVTPRVLPIDRVTFTNEAALETSRPHAAVLADSLDYAMVRDYVPGDPLKTIHWKLSARTEDYMTRLFEVYNNPGAAVLMDFYAPEAPVSSVMSMFDAVVESAFSLATYAREQGMDTELHYVNRYGERMRKLAWDGQDAATIIGELPRMSAKPAAAQDALELLRAIVFAQNGQNNLVVCTANLSADMVSLLIEAKARKRNPMMVAVIPPGLVGREREDCCAALQRLSAANIGYLVIDRVEDLKGVS